jgi:hypothetical protein
MSRSFKLTIVPATLPPTYLQGAQLVFCNPLPVPANPRAHLHLRLAMFAFFPGRTDLCDRADTRTTRKTVSARAHNIVNRFPSPTRHCAFRQTQTHSSRKFLSGASISVRRGGEGEGATRGVDLSCRTWRTFGLGASISPFCERPAA